MNKNALLETNLIWKIHSTDNRYFYVVIDEKIIILRINNFPEEPMFTIIDGLNIFDIEDKPIGWTFEE
ncbi:hypothetical protein [Myroides sp. C6-3]|uniref:hypothetical protein n=1 Tax=Myroides sp. C6-3 TaxID=3400535 RepID=UPI003D2F5AD5